MYDNDYEYIEDRGKIIDISDAPSNVKERGKTSKVLIKLAALTLGASLSLGAAFEGLQLANYLERKKEVPNLTYSESHSEYTDLLKVSLGLKDLDDYVYAGIYSSDYMKYRLDESISVYYGLNDDYEEVLKSLKLFTKNSGDGYYIGKTSPGDDWVCRGSYKKNGCLVDLYNYAFNLDPKVFYWEKQVMDNGEWKKKEDILTFDLIVGSGDERYLCKGYDSINGPIYNYNVYTNKDASNDDYGILISRTSSISDEKNGIVWENHGTFDEFLEQYQMSKESDRNFEVGNGIKL